MNRKPRILIIAPFYPLPLYHGGAQGFFSALYALMDQCEIYLILKNEAPYQKELESLLPKVTFLYYTPTQPPVVPPLLYRICKKLYHLAKRCLRGTVLTSENGFKKIGMTSLYNKYNEDYLQFVHRAITEYRIEIVQSEFPGGIDLICALPSGVKKVHIHHELRFVRIGHQIATYEYDHHLYARYCYNFLKNEELSLLAKYDAVIALSDIDTKKLQVEGLTNVHTSFSMVKKQENTDLHITEFHKCLTFIGPESHSPNRDGILWFLDNCWAPILQSNANLTLKIIGGYSKETQTEWGKKYKNLCFMGFVEDLYAVLKGTIQIVPIRIGSGIRMKIQEAANMGIPFVTTTVGVEGLPFRNGEECSIADTPDDFTKKVLELADNRELQNRYVAAAAKRIDEIFSYEKLAKSRISVYQEILNS